MRSPISKLFFPQKALASCVFAGIYRDTRNVALLDSDRLNHFPASPLVSVTFVFHGALVMLPENPDISSALPRETTPTCFVMGPSDSPVSSYSLGEVTAISIGLYHDAWLGLGGDADFKYLPRGLEDALASFADAADPDQGWFDFCAELESIWQERRPKGWRSVGGIADWGQSALTRAALANAGQSLRSVERRLKHMSGQTRRSLDFYSAFEDLHRIANQMPNIPLAEVAVSAGYSDQSHMGRVVRRATGFTPAQLNKAIQTDEAFWCYRLLGERF